MNKWIIQKTETLHKERIFSLKDVLCYHPEKKITHKFFRLETCDWVNVIAITRERKFILVKQHRLGMDTVTIESPGGLVENGVAPEESAKMELIEETGYRAGKIVLLKTLAVNPAIQNNYIHYFLALDCEKVSDQKLDDCEDIEILELSKDETLGMIREGNINHALVVNAFNLFFLSEYNF